jgi:hypothetical protein
MHAMRPPSVPLELQACGHALALHLALTVPDPAPVQRAAVDERIAAALQDADGPLSIKELRTACRVRNTTLYERLAALTRSGVLLRTEHGYQLIAEQ